MSFFGGIIKGLGSMAGNLLGGLPATFEGLGDLFGFNNWSHKQAPGGLKNLVNSWTGSDLTDAQKAQNQFAHDEAELSFQRQVDFYNQFQSPDAMMQQYKSAGLNGAVMMSGGNSGAQSPISAPQASSSSVPQSSLSLQDLFGLVLKAKTLPAELKLLESQANDNNASAGLKNAQATGQTITNEWLPQQLGANLENTKANTATLQDALKNNEVQRRLAESGISLNEANEALALKDAFLKDVEGKLAEQLAPLQLEAQRLDNELRKLSMQEKAAIIAGNWERVEEIRANTRRLNAEREKFNYEVGEIYSREYGNWLENAYKADALPLDLKAKQFNVDHLKAQFNWNKVGIITGAVKDAAVSAGAIYGATKMAGKPMQSKPGLWTPQPSRPLSSGEQMWLNNHPLK